MPDVFTSEKENKSSDAPLRKTLYKDLPMQKRKPLSSFLMCPQDINFETMEDEEKIILFLRQHFIVNIPWILIGILLFISPTIINLTPLLDSLPANFRLILILVWYLLSFAYVLLKFINWFFNVYIVTDERVVDVDFYNLIYKEVHDARIDKIEDQTYKMGGVIRTLFNYGDVLIQTAAEVPNFDFLAVPHPDKVVKVLQDLQNEEKQEEIEGRIR